MPVIIILIISLIASDAGAQPAAQAAVVQTKQGAQVTEDPPSVAPKEAKQKPAAPEAAVKEAEKAVKEAKRLTECAARLEELLKTSSKSMKSIQILYTPIKSSP